MDQDFITAFVENFLSRLQAIKVSEESIEAFRNRHQIVHTKAKQTLIDPGDICKYSYLIISGGFVCRYIHENSGAACTINFYLDDLHPIMACVDSFFTQVPTHCELKAIADSVVIATSKDLVDELRAKDPYFARFYHDVVVTAMVEENEVKTKLIAYSSREKYEFILQEMPTVIQKVPSKYIAEFCGISAEWLSKLKKQKSVGD
ncbi:MAG: Crp/Fnr family transcriptional regulator [Bacteroidota bacterium]